MSPSCLLFFVTITILVQTFFWLESCSPSSVGGGDILYGMLHGVRLTEVHNQIKPLAICVILNLDD